jgi:hypothetical protein
MPHSGIAFVSRARGAQPLYMLTTDLEKAVMYIERIVRNAGFALASFAIVVGVGYTLEYLPVVNLLAR